MPSVRSADSAARLPVRREQRDKWKECEAAGALVEEQLEAMTKERDEAEQDDSVQLAALRAELAAKSEELAAAVAATVRRTRRRRQRCRPARRPSPLRTQR